MKGFFNLSENVRIQDNLYEQGMCKRIFSKHQISAKTSTV